MDKGSLSLEEIADQLIEGNITPEEAERLSRDALSSNDNVVEDINTASSISSKEMSLEIPDELVLENLNEALEKAILDEEYELAAKLRDRIKQLEKKSIS